MTGFDEVTIGDCRLIHADCREVLPTLGKFDLLLTDPPYGVLSEDWDSMTKRELARFTMSWIGGYSSLSEWAIIFFGERTRDIISPLLAAIYANVRQLIWSKGGGSIAEDRMFYAFESIYFCHPDETVSIAEPKTMMVAQLLTSYRAQAGLSRGAVDMAVRGKKTGICFRWEEAACLPTSEQVEVLTPLLGLGADFLDAWSDAVAAKEVVASKMLQYSKEQAARNLDVFNFSVPTVRQHPTQKPVGLMTALLDLLPTAKSVLDPFMGSGTTGVACAQSGRAFTGIERERKYFDIAVERISRAYAQGKLFAPEIVKPEQGALV